MKDRATFFRSETIVARFLHFMVFFFRSVIKPYIKELVYGKNGKVHLVKLQTSHSEMLRPNQRIYPLEVSFSDGAENMFPNPAVMKNNKLSTFDGRILHRS